MMANKTVVSISKPTPMWATWVFRVVLIVATILNTSIVQAPRISQEVKLDIVYWSGIAVALVWALSRALGVDLEESKWKPK